MLYYEDPSEYPERCSDGDYPCRRPAPGEEMATEDQAQCPARVPPEGPWAERYWTCTRPEKHEGLHIAFMEPDEVIAVWGTLPDPPRWEIVED